MPGGNSNKDKKTTPIKKLFSAVAKMSPRGRAYAARAEITETGQSAAEPKKAVAFVDEQTLDYSKFGSEGVEGPSWVVAMNRTNPEDTPVSNRRVVMGFYRRNHSAEDISNAVEIPIEEVEQAIYDGDPETIIDLAKFHMEEAEVVEIGSDGNTAPLMSARAGSVTLDKEEIEQLAAELDEPLPEDNQEGDGDGDGQ